MPWKIVYHDIEPKNYKIGDMWPEPDWSNSSIVSNNYRKMEHKRPPLVVILPTTDPKYENRFLIDRLTLDSQDGWDITIIGDLTDGNTPNITISPSIHYPGYYHGYIRNGEISDDCEGRQYET